jgi:hypothetical protein
MKIKNYKGFLNESLQNTTIEIAFELDLYHFLELLNDKLTDKYNFDDIELLEKEEDLLEDFSNFLKEEFHYFLSEKEEEFHERDEYISNFVEEYIDEDMLEKLRKNKEFKNLNI